jgi:hypothetical protein
VVIKALPIRALIEQLLGPAPDFVLVGGAIGCSDTARMLADRKWSVAIAVSRVSSPACGEASGLRAQARAAGPARFLFSLLSRAMPVLAVLLALTVIGGLVFAALCTTLALLISLGGLAAIAVVSRVL